MQTPQKPPTELAQFPEPPEPGHPIPPDMADASSKTSCPGGNTVSFLSQLGASEPRCRTSTSYTCGGGASSCGIRKVGVMRGEGAWEGVGNPQRTQGWAGQEVKTRVRGLHPDSTSGPQLCLLNLRGSCSEPPRGMKMAGPPRRGRACLQEEGDGGVIHPCHSIGQTLLPS